MNILEKIIKTTRKEFKKLPDKRGKNISFLSVRTETAEVSECSSICIITNLSTRKIQGATGVARTTVQEYIKRCKESGIYSYEELTNLSDDSLNKKLFGASSIAISLNPSKIMPDYNYVKFKWS